MLLSSPFQIIMIRTQVFLLCSFVLDTFDVDLFLFSEFYQKPLSSIRTSLRQLEIQHALVVKASEPSALVKMIK